eukprot:gene12826-biopygen8814
MRGNTKFVLVMPQSARPTLALIKAVLVKDKMEVKME